MDQEKSKTFLEEVQSLDEPTKRRALVIASAVVMVLVVYVWIGYFNSIVIGGQEQAQVAENDAQAQAQTPAPAPSTGPNVWQNMEGGMASIYKSFGAAFYDLGHLFGASRQYTIQPQK